MFNFTPHSFQSKIQKEIDKENEKELAREKERRRLRELKRNERIMKERKLREEKERGAHMASEKAKPTDEEQMEDDEIVVVMTDDEGNEYYYTQELILEVLGDKYALLVPTCADEGGEDCHCHDCEDDEDEDSAFFAKMVLDESGEEAYIEPTDEEFEAVMEAYEALMDEEENED